MNEQLDRRYRRLLRVYPVQHRLEYQTEMLAVLLESAHPGQRRPEMGDVADLLRGAVVAHARTALADLQDDAWRQAASVMHIFGSLVMLGVALREITLRFALFAPIPWTLAGLREIDLQRSMVWALVALAAVLRWRQLTSPLAVVALIVEANRVNWQVISPTSMLSLAFLMTMAIVVLIASIWAVGEAGPRPRGTLMVIAAAVLLVGSGLAGPFVVGDFGDFGDVKVGSVWISPIIMPVYVLAIALVLWAGARQPVMIFRRLFVLALPICTTALLVPYTLEFMDAHLGMSSSLPLIPTEWGVLIITPPAAFFLGFVLLRILERRLGVVRLANATTGDKHVTYVDPQH